MTGTCLTDPDENRGEGGNNVIRAGLARLMSKAAGAIHLDRGPNAVGAFPVTHGFYS
jgi:hypothetical protein